MRIGSFNVPEFGSGITNDPNRLDDEQYIVRLVGRVITVSIETVSSSRNWRGR